MAAASSSSYNSSQNNEETYKYDVFISFRGEDTRDNFTSHLHAALERKNIKTFIDYQLKKGGEISLALENAIEASKLCLVIFSKDYASSTWCLNELVKIIHCMKSSSGSSDNKQLVIPIFYKITPSEVRKQSGSFKDAFSKHQRSERKEKVQSWSHALIDAAALAGWDSSVTRPESFLVDKIVKDVLKKLQYDSLPYIEGLVGIDSRIKIIKSLLNIDECSDVCSIGIWGMAGIGKTTIAQVLFNQIYLQFEGRCFLENVKDKARKHDGLFSLREKLLSKLLDEDGIYLETLRTQCSYINSRLRRRKVLMVLDDITDPEQFELLVGALNGFGPGSRIIVTSRDRQVLINCGVEEDKIFKLVELEHHDALELFHHHAFRKNHPPYELLEPLDAVMNYAGGNPLALKVLGSSLQNKSHRYWEETLKKLKQVPIPKIYDVLRISFDGLDDEQKRIFLDIACFFSGIDRDHIIEILASSYCSVYSGIEDLIEKSLLTLSDANILHCHDLLQEMGWTIGRRSRLCTSEDVCHVLRENSGTKLIEGISLDMSKVGKMHLSPTVFSEMKNLRLLKFFYSGEEKEPKLLLPEHGIESFPSELRYLYWEGYPLRTLPSNFNLEKLVEFSMPHSNLEDLWNSPVDLVNLKKINLSYSKISSAIKLLPKLQCLTHLGLSGSPIKDLPASVGCLKKLVTLDLIQCKALNNLPNNIRELDSLEEMALSGCISLAKFPEIPDNIIELQLCETAIEEVPLSIGRLLKLRSLEMEDCINLKRLPPSICKLTSLEYLNLSRCRNLESCPEISEKMKSLINLYLGGTAIKELPHSTFRFGSLETLELRQCHFLDEWDDSNAEVFSSLSSLGKLDLSENNFERLPNLEQLSELKELDISFCKRLKSLTKLPPILSALYAHGCTSLERLENFHFHSSLNYTIDFSNCFKLVQHGKIDDIVENAHLYIHFMAAMDEEIFNQLQDEQETISVSLTLPTSKIPAWFNNRSIGSSIAVQLPPPGCQSSQFLDFAFCVVLEFDSHSVTNYEWYVEIDCYFRSNQGYNQRLRFRPWTCSLDHVPFSDHLLITYDYMLRAKLIKRNIRDSLTEASFEFHPVTFPASTKFAKVKECGLHLLYNYTEECPHNILTYNEGQSSKRLRIEEEEDPQPHRKKIKHCNLDFVEQMIREDDGNSGTDRGCTDNYCYSRAEPGASLEVFNDDEDKKLKEMVKKFNLWYPFL